MCVQYRGRESGGVQYCGGIHDACEGICTGVSLVTWGDTMINVGDIFSAVGDSLVSWGVILNTVGDTQYRVGYHEYRGG